MTSFFGIKVCVFFLENDKPDLRQIFFQGLGENTCSIITTGTEKHCTRPLSNLRVKIISILLMVSFIRVS